MPTYTTGAYEDMSSTASLATLTPTAPGIYPQLTTATEDVKD